MIGRDSFLKSPRGRRVTSSRRLTCEALEPRQMLSATMADYEQYLLELVNRARANPGAEAAGFSVDLNEGLAAGTISAAAKQPLAMNQSLVAAADGHSQWMLDTDTFSHTGAGGSQSKDRMEAAGYIFTAPWGGSENLGISLRSGAYVLYQEVTDLHTTLFVDAGVTGRGHRLNILNGDFTEVGVGIRTGQFIDQGTTYGAIALTQDFVYSGTSHFLTGVVYDDSLALQNNFYTPGEGLGGISIVATRQSDSAVFTTTTLATGGYSLALPNGAYDITVSGAGLGGTITRTGIVMNSLNVKQDFKPTDVPGPSLSIGNVTAVEGNSSTKKFTFPVTLSKASISTVTVRYSTADGSATAADKDYNGTSGTLTFKPGETSKTVTVMVRGDRRFELDETFQVVLSNATVATISQATATGTIQNDDSQPVLSVNSSRIAEGGTLKFTVKLSAVSGQPVTVSYAGVSDTAVSGVDFAATANTLTFAPGETSKTVYVATTNDTLDEVNETFKFVLSGATGATIGAGTGIGTITDNDPAPKITIGDVSVDEAAGAAVFTVSLSGPSGQEVRVNFTTAKGTATAEVDYSTTAGTLVFAPGETSKTISVPIIDDSIVETNETFKVSLSRAVNGSITRSSAVGTILDNDAGMTLALLAAPTVHRSAAVSFADVALLRYLS